LWTTLNLLQIIQWFCCWMAIVTHTKCRCNWNWKETRSSDCLSHATLYTQTPTFRCLHHEPTKNLLCSGDWNLEKEQSLPFRHSLSGSWAYGESLPSCCHNGEYCQWFPIMWDFST
jgi:hypothetical protein